jgi:hypothetical protein
LELDVRVGRQIVARGRADGVNPTDNLTGEDLTLLTPDDDDRRLGTTAVRASYYPGDISFTGFWLPEFRGHRFPLPPAPGLTFAASATSGRATSGPCASNRQGAPSTGQSRTFADAI